MNQTKTACLKVKYSKYSIIASRLCQICRYLYLRTDILLSYSGHTWDSLVSNQHFTVAYHHLSFYAAYSWSLSSVL